MKTVALDVTSTTETSLEGANDVTTTGAALKEAARAALREAMSRPSFEARIRLVRSLVAER